MATPKKDSKTTGTRTCIDCGETKSIAEFEHTPRGTRRVCIPCINVKRAKKASASPESYLHLLNAQLKSQRVKQGIQYDLTTEDVVALWHEQGGRCAISGVIMTHQRDGAYGDGKKRDFNASIDRITASGPYTRKNVQLVANRVNTMKHTLGDDMFMWWVKTIYEKMGE